MGRKEVEEDLPDTNAVIDESKDEEPEDYGSVKPKEPEDYGAVDPKVTNEKKLKKVHK